MLSSSSPIVLPSYRFPHEHCLFVGFLLLVLKQLITTVANNSNLIIAKPTKPTKLLLARKPLLIAFLVSCCSAKHGALLCLGASASVADLEGLFEGLHCCKSTHDGV